MDASMNDERVFTSPEFPGVEVTCRPLTRKKRTELSGKLATEGANPGQIAMSLCDRQVKRWENGDGRFCDAHDAGLKPSDAFEPELVYEVSGWLMEGCRFTGKDASD